jgi:hypothetical protein
MESQQRVAIVGSGLAGLVSAHLLHGDRQQRYAVKIFESVRPTCWCYTSSKIACTDSTGYLLIARLSLYFDTQCRTNVIGPRRSAHARLCWWLLQQSESSLRPSRSSLPLAAIPLRICKATKGLFDTVCLVLCSRFEPPPTRTTTKRCWIDTIPDGGAISDSLL